jgi:hypothetical protein
MRQPFRQLWSVYGATATIARQPGPKGCLDLSYARPDPNSLPQPNPRRIAPLTNHPMFRRPWENESPQMNAASPDRRPVTEEPSGVIERVTFHNDDSGFCVLRVKTKGYREETSWGR